jgi:type IV pilus assembly protein PilQ
MLDYKKKIKELLEKSNRRVLIRVSVFIVVAVLGYGAMEFFSAGKPLPVVAKAKPVKDKKKTAKTNAVAVKADANNLDNKIDTDKKKINLEEFSDNFIEAEESDVNTVKDNLKAAITGINSVRKLIKNSRIDLNDIDIDVNDIETETNIADMDNDGSDSNDFEPETAEVDVDSVDTDYNVMDEDYEADEIQSLVFMKNMEIQDALHLLAAKYKRNIVPSPAVTGQLAFENLYDVTFEEAMDAILGTDFRYEQKGNLIKVYPRDKGEMVHKIFVLYYISAAEAKKLVSQVLSQEGKIEVTAAAQKGVPAEETISAQSSGGDDTAMNDTLIIYDYPENVERAEQVIASVDIRPRQVLIEATILSATLTEGMQFGIDWQTIKSVVIQELADLTRDTQDYFSSAGTSAKTGTSSLSGGLTIGFVHDDVAGFIRAVEEVTDVTILANPKIMAVNKQLGQIYIGKKVAYQSQTTQTDTSTTEQVEFLDTGTKLSFRPYIGNDGYIRMDIHPKDSSATLRSSGTATLPDETSAELVTNIMVRDGQTIVIGGLFRDRITTTRTQVPVLGDIPVIGGLFRGKADEIRREEVIVLLTPHIITDPNQADGQKQQYDVQRKMIGARDELQLINKIRRANEYYDNAAEYYLQGDHKAALKELDAALRLYPAYLEAIRLKELVTRELYLRRLKANAGR